MSKKASSYSERININDSSISYLKELYDSSSEEEIHEEPTKKNSKGIAIKSSQRLIEPPIKKNGWDWIICITSFWINGFVFGILNSYELLIEDIRNTFHSKDPKQTTMVAWIGTVTLCLTFLCSPFSFTIIDKSGFYITCLSGSILCFAGLFLSSYAQSIYHLCLSYSVMCGIGLSLLYGPSLAILGKHYTARLGLANGIATMGSSIFYLYFPSTLKRLLIRFQLRTTLKILGALSLVTILFVCTFGESKQSKNINKSYTKKLDILNIVQFILWLIGLVVALFGYFIPFYFLIKYVEELGFDSKEFMIYIGATSALSKLFFGFLSDHKKINPIALQQISFAVIGAATMLLSLAKTYNLILTLTIIIGFFDCGYSLVMPIVFNLVGKEYGEEALYCTLFILAVPFSAGLPIAEYIFFRTNSFKLIFIIGGIPLLTGAAIMHLNYIMVMPVTNDLLLAHQISSREPFV